MSRLLHSIRTTTRTGALVALLATLSACGGGSAAAPAAGAPTTPTTPTNPGPVDTSPQNPTIVGVETPNGVSVVTATNAN
jgi:ABC-type glycerol-3-phosphate transport system substrate-binding protein